MPMFRLLDLAAGLKEVKSAEATLKALRDFKSEFSTFNKLLESVKVREIGGEVRVGEEGLHMNTLHDAILAGDFEKLLKLSGSEAKLSAVDRNLIRESIPANPHKALFDLKESFEGLKSKFDHLNVKVSDVEKGAVSAETKDAIKELNAKLKSPSFKVKLARFAAGVTVPMLLGGVAIYEIDRGIEHIAKRRIGCFWVETNQVTGKTTSCKISRNTCGEYKSLGDLCKTTTKFRDSVTNTPLLAMHIANLEDSDETKMKLASSLGVSVGELKAQLKAKLDSNFKEIKDFVNESTIKEKFNMNDLNLCDITNPNIDQLNPAICRMCDTSASENSVAFVDSKYLPTNVTVHCSTDPTILETVIDLAKSTATDLLSGLGKGIASLFKPLLVIIAVILSLALVGFIAMKGFKRKPKLEAPA